MPTYGDLDSPHGEINRDKLVLYNCLNDMLAKAAITDDKNL